LREVAGLAALGEAIGGLAVCAAAAAGDVLLDGFAAGSTSWRGDETRSRSLTEIRRHR